MTPTPSEGRDGLVVFLTEAARYFEKRDTKGEDRAFWANVFNAEKCRKAAAEITRLRAEAARKDEALLEAANYLDALEAALIRHDADMGIDTETPPSLIADRCRAARMPAEGRAAIEQEGG